MLRTPDFKALAASWRKTIESSKFNGIIPGYHKFVVEKLGYEEARCNRCRAHIRNGICLNACHLSEEARRLSIHPGPRQGTQCNSGLSLERGVRVDT